MSFGERLMNLRKKNGITQENLAERLDVSRQTVSKWELNQSAPSLSHIEQLSDLFEVTTDYLILGKENKVAPKNDNGLKKHSDIYTNNISMTVVGFIVILMGVFFFLAGQWGPGITMLFIGIELILIMKNAFAGAGCAIIAIVCMVIFMYIIPDEIVNRMVLNYDPSGILVDNFKFDFNAHNIVLAINMLIVILQGLVIGLRKDAIYSRILMVVSMLSMICLILFGGCHEFVDVAFSLVYFGILVSFYLNEFIKKKKYISVAVIVDFCFLLLIAVGVFIGGQNTAKAKEFNDYLISHKWKSSTEIGGGKMRFSDDGTYSYRGLDDGNGPFGYDFYEYYEYNGLLEKIIVHNEFSIRFIDVLDYDEHSMTLGIEGYIVEFKGEVREK